MMGKEVIFFTSEFPPGPGGVGNHAYCLANQLHDRDFSICIISVRRAEFDNDPSATFSYEVNKVKSDGVKLIKYIELVRMLHKKVKSHQPSRSYRDPSRSYREQPIIIASGMLMLILLGFYSIFYRRLFKAIAIAHGFDINASNRIHRLLVDFGLSKCDKIVAVSQYTAKKINNKFNDRIVVINNGFDQVTLNGAVDVIKLAGSPSLVTVGSISERKGQQNVVKVLPKLMGQFPSVHYHCIGIATHKSLVTEIAESLDVQNRVTIYGALPTPQLVLKLAGSDIFMMLSGHTAEGDFEGFGIAILEANYLGIPAIGSRNSGIADAIRDQYSGILVNENDPEEITSAVAKIMNNYKWFSDNAKAHVSDFDWPTIAGVYIQLIDGVYDKSLK